jgi:L,D-peptidoglycan transpeptidase YkuD (ErfK/YbiS/YcfS/YnhG family)
VQSYSKIGDRNRNCGNIPRRGLTLTVRTRPGKPAQGLIVAGNRVMRCALGRSGIRALKREGDGATPLAAMAVLGGYYRRGRFGAQTRLPMRPIRPDLGWCDTPGDANYNRPVRLPCRASHERLLRSDRLYDAVIVLGWNIRPRARNLGSAIFLHVARPGYAPTEGCVAVSARDMAWLLERVGKGSVVRVVR